MNGMLLDEVMFPDNVLISKHFHQIFRHHAYDIEIITGLEPVPIEFFKFSILFELAVLINQYNLVLSNYLIIDFSNIRHGQFFS